MRDWLPKSRVQHRIVLRSSRACSGVSSRDAAALEHFGYRNGRTTNFSSIDSELYVVDVDGHCSMGQDGGETGSKKLEFLACLVIEKRASA